MDIFSLRKVTDQEIEEQVWSIDQLWYVKGIDDEKVYGPLVFDDIKYFLEDNPDFPLTTKLASYKNPEKWLSLSEISEFSKLTSNVTSAPKKDEIYLLHNGQKDGPYNSTRVKEKLDKKELLFNDIASIDRGNSWIRIYQIPFFSEDNHERSVPPTAPQEQSFFSLSDEEVIHVLQDNDEIKGSGGGLTDLAYTEKSKIINIAMDKQDLDKIDTDQTIHVKKELNKYRKKKKYLKFALTTLLGIGIVSGLFYIIDKEDKLFSPEDKAKSKDKHSNYKRSFASRKDKIVPPPPVVKSSKKKKRKNSADRRNEALEARKAEKLRNKKVRNPPKGPKDLEREKDDYFDEYDDGNDDRQDYGGKEEKGENLENDGHEPPISVDEERPKEKKAAEFQEHPENFEEEE